MRGISLRRPSPAMVVACVALGVALAGTSYATVVQVPKNSVGTAQLKSSAVTTKKLAANSVTAAKVKNGSLLKADFGPGQLPAGATGPQGPAGPAGPSGLSATERVEVTTTTSSISPRNAQIQCPAGKRLLGGGARLNGTAPTVAIQSSFPDNDNVYRVVARELVANQGSWSVTAFAICAIAS